MRGHRGLLLTRVRGIGRSLRLQIGVGDRETETVAKISIGRLAACRGGSLCRATVLSCRLLISDRV